MINLLNRTRSLAVSWKAKHALTLCYDSAVELLGFSLNELETYMYINACTQMTGAALSVIVEA